MKKISQISYYQLKIKFTVSSKIVYIIIEQHNSFTQVYVPRSGIPQICYSLLYWGRTDRFEDQTVFICNLCVHIRYSIASGNWHRHGSGRRGKRCRERTNGSNITGKFIN